MYCRNPQQYDRIVNEIPSRKIVGRVEHDVAGPKRPQSVARIEMVRVRGDGDGRVQMLQPSRRNIDLTVSDVAISVEDLALKVRDADSIAIEKLQCSDPGSREVLGGWTSQTSESHNPNAGRLEFQLAAFSHSGQREMATVADQLVRSQTFPHAGS
jgi:hypothetical protein